MRPYKAWLTVRRVAHQPMGCHERMGWLILESAEGWKGDSGGMH